MWALRRASATLRKQGLSIENTQFRFAAPCISNRLLEECDVGVYFPAKGIYDRLVSFRNFHKMADSSPASSWGTCKFSSQADTKSSGVEDDEFDGFSDLESPATLDAIQNDIADNNEDLVSEPDLPEEATDDLDKEREDLLDSDAHEDPISKKRFASTLFKEILDDPASTVSAIITKWKEKGNKLTRSEVAGVMIGLHRRRMFGKALQLSECLESCEEIDLTDRDFACRVDLIAKVQGLQKAEAYMKKIPKHFSSELVYRTFLASCVSAANVRKAEEVFNKMKELGFSISSFAFNQLILLYKKTDNKKIADVLFLMDKDGVKPSRFTYEILIDTKGQLNDIDGMEKIVEAMKSDGVEPDTHIKGLLAKHYIAGGHNEKAEAVLKEMERGNDKGNHLVCHILFPFYASLGKAEEVSRLWQVCKSKPSISELMAAIHAWGTLKRFEEAEEAFDTLVNKHRKAKNLISRAYHVLLSVYADNKMLVKGKELVKKMEQNNCPIGPLTWDALVKLYCNAGEVERADYILNTAANKSQRKPLYRSYDTIMEQYAERGDVHNCEKMLYKMRQVGYTSRLRQFQVLLQAYINANVPAYGMKERLKADNVFPNRTLAGMLAKVDGFRKTTLPETPETAELCV